MYRSTQALASCLLLAMIADKKVNQLFIPESKSDLTSFIHWMFDTQTVEHAVPLPIGQHNFEFRSVSTGRRLI